MFIVNILKIFYCQGNYAGFDEKQPTCNDNGKATVIQLLKDRHGYKRLIHIGDGVTDLDACPPAVRLFSSSSFGAKLTCNRHPCIQR
jgi:2-hydroxy-3-keto-5-methylthiopentenyl-1-phosphate phosphatase